jgi:hypothetical protein
MKTYPVAQQIKYLYLKAEIDALLLELQDKSQQSQNVNGVRDEDRVYLREVAWKAA